jgi:hypothetical protein
MLCMEQKTVKLQVNIPEDTHRLLKTDSVFFALDMGAMTHICLKHTLRQIEEGTASDELMADIREEAARQKAAKEARLSEGDGAAKKGRKK